MLTDRTPPAPEHSAHTRHELPRTPAHKVPPTARAALSLSRTAGNAAVVRMLARDTLPQAPRKPAPVRVGALEGGPIEFATNVARLGELEIHFEGHLTIVGQATLQGDSVPDDKNLPDPTNRNHAARVHKWSEGRVHNQLKAALDALTPTTKNNVIELDVFGRTLTLELAYGVAGMPEFEVYGQFDSSRADDIAVGTVNMPKAKLVLQATAVVKPAPANGPTVLPQVNDSVVKKGGFVFDGVAAELDDRPVSADRPDLGTHRSGAVAVTESLNQIEALPDVVKKRWSLSNTEKKLAFLVHMRSYFATDAETIEHFKQLRRVELHKKGAPTDLILHEQAAARLEAVRDELPAGAMPSTDIGWPRGEPSLHGRAGIWNLHDIGLAVDFNATETPNLTDWRQKDLIYLITGGQAWQSGAWTEGDYAEMSKHRQERVPTPDPAPSSDAGKTLTKVESEAQAASERSEAFRSSIDTPSLLELRARRRDDKAAWTAEDDAALAAVIEPWTAAVEDELTDNAKTLTEAGFDIATLEQGKELTQEKANVSAAVAAAAVFRKTLKADTLTDLQRKKADELIAKLSLLVGATATDANQPADDSDRIKAIDDLTAAAKTRLGGYGAAAWRERLQNLRTSLDNPAWVLGDSDWNPGKHKWETQVKDPSPAQLADLGFFTLREHSRSAASGKAQAGAFDIRFIRAMVKHGFNMLSNSATPVDSMHFELRWHGSAAKKK